MVVVFCFCTTVTLLNEMVNKQDILRNKVSLWLLLYSVIMADFIMPETQQPIIVIILIIYSSYLLKDIVEL